MTDSADVVVLGAGPAGLMAAWRAALAGHQVTLVEAAPSVGGLAASFEVAGIRVDLGSHRLHPAVAPEVRAALDGLLGADLQERLRHGRLRLADRWVRFPLDPVDLVRHLPPRFAAGAAADAVLAPVRRRRSRGAAPESFVDEIRTGLGPTVSRWFYEPYVEKLWGVDPATLDAELARRRVAARSASAIARRLARRGPGPGRTFLYPRRGFGQISEALADAATAHGADLRLGHRVVEVHTGEPHGVVVEAGPAGDAVEIQAGIVLSTLPLGALVAALRPTPPSDVLGAGEALGHRAMVIAHLVVDRPRYTEWDAHYLSGADDPVSRLSEPKNYRTSADDPAERTVLCAEIPCWEGDDRWRAAPDEIGAQVRAALMADGLPDPDPVATEVRRLPRVYPQFTRGFAARQERVEAWLETIDGLATLGRQGLFVGDNTHHVLAMGWAAAAAVTPDGRLDRTAWTRARDGFRTHVVED